MKRRFKAMLKWLWRKSAPLWSPIVRRVDGHLARVVAGALADHPSSPFEQLTRAVHAARQEADQRTVETNLAIDSLVREVTRLHWQLESLEAIIQGECGRLETSDKSANQQLSLVADDHTTTGRDNAPQMRAG